MAGSEVPAGVIGTAVRLWLSVLPSRRGDNGESFGVVAVAGFGHASFGEVRRDDEPSAFEAKPALPHRS